MRALQVHFREKRDFVVGRLREIGFRFKEENVPQSTFYVWLDLSGLPEGLNDGLNFFQKCLEEKVIVVPGSELIPLLSPFPWHYSLHVSYFLPCFCNSPLPLLSTLSIPCATVFLSG